MSFGAGPLPHCFLRVWQTEDGLPDNKVMAVTQTKDGYIWVGTYSGLARFDGLRFTVFDNSTTREMHSPQVTSLFAADDGTLWIGHANGEVTSYKAGVFRDVPVKAAWEGEKILGIGADAQGDIWLVNEDGLLARLRDGLVLTPVAGTQTNLVAMARSAGGTIWVARDGQISALKQGRLETVEFAGDAATVYLQGIGASGDGELWALTDLRMHKRVGPDWGESLDFAPWGMSAVHCLLETREGMFAAATADQGLFLVSREGQSVRFCRTNGFPIDWVTSVCQDQEGNLWVGTGGGGLVELHKSYIENVTPPDRWQNRAILAVQKASDDALWVGTEGAGLYRYKDGNWNIYRSQDGLANEYIWSIAEDAQGQIWAGTWGGGLFVRQGEQFIRAPGLETFLVPIPALLPARDGGLWAGTAVGLMRYNAGKISRFGQSTSQPLQDIRALAEDRQGGIWVGMLGGGLVHLKNGQVRSFHKADGLSSDFVQCLYLETNDVLWVGTLGGGLTRVKDERLTAIGQEQGLANMVICSIMEDDQGRFWIGSHDGILQVSKDELNNCADGNIKAVHCLTCGRSDGLPTLQCSGGFQPACSKTADGRLWLPTAKGLVALDPRNVVSNSVPPPVVVEDFLVDGQSVAVAPVDEPLRIGPGRNQLEFRYTALSFIASDRIRFKRRLVGLDPDWVDAGPSRRAVYSYIPPGEYTFKVTACNSDGVWNDAGTGVAFTLLPHWWQTWWFRAAAIAALSTTLAGLVRYDTRRRMRRKMERLERQRAIEHERARIAKDIHDDLGASLTRITMLSQLGRGDLADADEATANLDCIYSTARELTSAMDEIVWAVNPMHDTLDSLASYLGKFGQDFLRAAQIRCFLLVPVDLPAWPLSSEQRHNLFLAYKEALHNIVKHSHASEVRVSLTLQKDSFVLSVEDNGCGLNGSATQTESGLNNGRIESGNGLANMKLRLEEIRGRCELSSETGRGTCVKFTVPLKYFNLAR